MRRLVAESRLVRIVRLSEKGRITQFVTYVEPQIRTKRMPWKWAPPLLVFVSPTPSPNLEVLHRFKKFAFFVFSSSRPTWYRIADGLAYSRYVRAFRWRKPFIEWQKAWEYRSRHGVVQRSDEYSTDQLLADLGLDPRRPVVLLSLRDPAYYRALQGSERSLPSGREVTSETDVRNPEIESYRGAVSFLAQRNFSVVRVGVDVLPLDQSWRSILADYGSALRTDRSDVLLARRARFLLNGASGFWAIAAIFDTPQVSTNMYAPFFGSGVFGRDVFAPQLRRVIATGNMQTFREMAATAWKYSYESNLERDAVKLVKNKSEEIVELVVEMLARLDGSFHETKADVKRRERFEEIRNLSTGVWERGRIGTAFLRRYEHLLD